MFALLTGIIVRIFSNSYLNVFQKLLANKGEKASVINFYTYLGLTILGFVICPNPIITAEIIKTMFLMGFLGAIGNYLIIKAVSCGELSSLAPINSYKPVFALILGIFLLKELPNIEQILGIALIVLGTIILGNNNKLRNKATLYRFFALIFSGAEAIFIKKIILLSDVATSFLYWAFASLIFVTIFVILSKHPIKIKIQNVKYQFILILLVALMQYSTNYVFSMINVAYALALFQLSTILSVILGFSIFKEKNILQKIVASLIMIIGAIIILIV